MPIIFDFKCPKCGNLEQDYLLKDSKDISPNCKICGEVMEKLFTGIQVHHGIKHHNKLPSNYKPSRGGARFGRVEDL